MLNFNAIFEIANVYFQMFIVFYIKQEKYDTKYRFTEYRKYRRIHT